MLEGMLARREDAREATAAVPPSPLPPPPRPEPKRPAPFSADSQIFPQGGGESSLSEFVTRILDELDSMVDGTPGPVPARGPRDDRPTDSIATPSAPPATEAPPARGAMASPAPPSAPGAAGKRLSTKDLSDLQSLFDDDPDR
jgi:hypothetical protein